MQTPDRGQPLRILLIFILLTVLLIPLYTLPSMAVRHRLSDFTLTETDDALPVRHVEKTYTMTLPHEILPDSPAILLRVLHSSVKVELEGEVLYEHEQGRRDHILPLKKSHAGKTLFITLTPSQERAFRTPFPVRYGEYRDLMKIITLYGLLPFLVAVLLGVYGVVFLALSLFLIPRVPGIRIRVYAALIMVISSVWLLCYHGFFELLSPVTHVVVLEYSIIFLAVPVYLGYLRLMRLPMKQNAFLYTVLFIALLILAGSWYSVQSRTYASGFLMLYYLLCACAFIFTAFMFFRIRKEAHPDPSSLVRLAGFAVYLFTCLVHILCYFLYDYRGITRDLFSLNAITIGAAALLESQLIDYFLYASRVATEEVERPGLMEMAYRDFLTKLPNRTDAERVFERMSRSSLDFCIVMLDLNGLKDVNDKSGHDAGDRLIVNFARVLRASFGDGAYLARLGGDEFIAVLEGESSSLVKRHLKTLSDALRKLDAAEPDVRHSVSFGYAFRHECAEETGVARDGTVIETKAMRRAADQLKRVRSENVRSASSSRYARGSDILQRVLALADVRMYAHKRSLKAQSTDASSADL